MPHNPVGHEDPDPDQSGTSQVRSEANQMGGGGVSLIWGRRMLLSFRRHALSSSRLELSLHQDQTDGGFQVVTE